MSKKRILREVNEILSIGDDNELGLTYGEFDYLLETMKDHPYYDDDYWPEDVEFSDVKGYVETCEPHEWSELVEVVEGDGAAIFHDLEVKTLADIQRAELLIKLYNNTSSVAELEKMLKKKFRNGQI